jgi:ferredoxin-NADP reductase
MFTQLLKTIDTRDGSALRPAIPSPRSLARAVVGSSLVEALAAPHGIDRYLELIRPGSSLHELRARVVHVRRQTNDSVTVLLRPNRHWRGFRAGQFVAVTVEVDGVRRTRCYSPANSELAVDGCLELTIRSHAHGIVSRHLRESARPGDIVTLAQADGDFVLPSPRPEQLLLISGGSGITPVMSMLRTLCDEGHTGAVTFVHYARTPREAIYRAELATLLERHPNVRVVPVYTGRTGRGVLHGHFSREQLTAIAPEFLGAPVYVCGPPGLVDAVRDLWTEVGAQQTFHSESFLPVRMAPPADENGGAVRLRSSAIEFVSTGATLLEQAESAGIRPMHGCRMGICHTCTCRKLSGHVRNVRTGELSSAEEQDIQICVSVPAGDVEVDL